MRAAKAIYFNTVSFLLLSFLYRLRGKLRAMATTEKETPSKKAAAPSVSQINAEYVTQVTLLYLHTARRFCSSILPLLWYHSGPKRYSTHNFMYSCLRLFIYIFFFHLLFQLANKYWAPHSKNKLPFDPKVSYISIVALLCAVYTTQI